MILHKTIVRYEELKPYIVYSKADITQSLLFCLEQAQYAIENQIVLDDCSSGIILEDSALTTTVDESDDAQKNKMAEVF